MFPSHDLWLTSTWLEGGGGGNGGESYHLAWFFGAFRTSTDSWEKRGKKGLLITIGDEPVHRQVSKHTLKEIMGTGEFKDYTAAELLDKARETYEVYHINMTSTYTGRQASTQDGWKELMGDNVVMCENREEISNVVSDLVLKHSVGETVQSVTSESEQSNDEEVVL